MNTTKVKQIISQMETNFGTGVLPLAMELLEAAQQPEVKGKNNHITLRTYMKQNARYFTSDYVKAKFYIKYAKKYAPDMVLFSGVELECFSPLWDMIERDKQIKLTDDWQGFYSVV